MQKFICYCFKHTEADIIKDLKENGRSTILEKIIEAKRTNGCNCIENHPEKRWCLSDVRRVVDINSHNKIKLF